MDFYLFIILYHVKAGDPWCTQERLVCKWNIYLYFLMWQMQGELSVKRSAFRPLTLQLVLYVAATVQFLVSMLSPNVSHESSPVRQVYSVETLSIFSSYELNYFSIVLGVWINALGLHCCLKKQSCPPLSTWPHLPALGLERISLLPVWIKTSYFQGWFSVGSSGQPGTAPKPVMSSTHTKELMAMYGRKEADSDWFKLIIKAFNESC